jgi:hypothetical protein
MMMNSWANEVPPNLTGSKASKHLFCVFKHSWSLAHPLRADEGYQLFVTWRLSPTLPVYCFRLHIYCFRLGILPGYLLSTEYLHKLLPKAFVWGKWSWRQQLTNLAHACACSVMRLHSVNCLSKNQCLCLACKLDELPLFSNLRCLCQAAVQHAGQQR